ncbi:restriction endonuclease [Scytonema sp. PCC 10023]|uniref:restriction endonuclease n=1 Tax=Scytonema sp. PCC 10023 TaxID=1680591 RepID=UPI0039C5FD3E
MTADSTEFEQQIKRIHDLIEQPGSVVTWNDHLPDPDNPDQLRQIDISIKRDGKLTLVECRIHKKKQDVKWIEELIGRKVSLRADALIAVSASGFTKLAIRKAEAHSIFLRDLLTLTDEEIRQWGNKAKIWANYLKFENPKIICVFHNLPKDRSNLQSAFIELLTKKDLIYLIFDKVSKQIDSITIPYNGALLQSQLDITGLNLAGHSVSKIKFSSEILLITKEILAPYVLVYGSPNIPSDKREIKLEKVDLGKSQITQTSNKASIVLDISNIETLPKSHFLHLIIDLNRVVTSNIETIGLKAPSILLEDMNFSVAFE